MSNALVVARRFGISELSAAMPACPSLPEITASSPAGSLRQHPPAVAARVYLMKMNVVMDMIISKSLFGQWLSHCMRIEWQVQRVKILRHSALYLIHCFIASGSRVTPCAYPHCSRKPSHLFKTNWWLSCHLVSGTAIILF
jgi:hypothetical protein